MASHPHSLCALCCEPIGEKPRERNASLYCDQPLLGHCKMAVKRSKNSERLMTPGFVCKRASTRRRRITRDWPWRRQNVSHSPQAPGLRSLRRAFRHIDASLVGQQVCKQRANTHTCVKSCRPQHPSPLVRLRRRRPGGLALRSLRSATTDERLPTIGSKNRVPPATAERGSASQLGRHLPDKILMMPLVTVGSKDGKGARFNVAACLCLSDPPRAPSLRVRKRVKSTILERMHRTTP